MFAVIKTGGKQYRVAANDVLTIEKLEGEAGDEDWASLAVAFIAATLTGFAAVRWLLAYIANHRFTPFAWYRIGLGVALLLGLPAGA